MWKQKTLDEWPAMAKSFTGAITAAFESSGIPMPASHLNNELTDTLRAIQDGSGWCIYSDVSNVWISYEECEEFPQFMLWKYTYSETGRITDDELVSFINLIKSSTDKAGIIAVGRKGWIRKLTRLGFESAPMDNDQIGVFILF